MTRHDFDWIDAFADAPFGGNGCAVVHDAGGLDADTCMAFVRETGLVECTFLEASDRATVKVRYFMPTRQIPFAGHPTIATVASLLHRGLAGASPLTLETGAGIVPIDVHDPSGPLPLITMTQRAPEFGPLIDPAIAASVGGIEAGDIVGVPQIVSTGLPFCIVLVRDRAVLERLALDPGALGPLKAAAGVDDSAVLEPYWITREGATGAGATFARLLLAPPMPPEDPFTGSATGCAAAYLWHHGLIGAPTYVAEQGHAMGRPGRAEVTVLGPPKAITGVQVAGTGRVVMTGQVLL